MSRRKVVCGAGVIRVVAVCLLVLVPVFLVAASDSSGDAQGAVWSMTNDDAVECASHSESQCRDSGITTVMNTRLPPPVFGRTFDDVFQLGLFEKDGALQLFDAPEGFDLVYYLEVLNVGDISSVCPKIVFGSANEKEVELCEKVVLTTAEIKADFVVQIIEAWEFNSFYTIWNEEDWTYTFKPVQEVFSSIEDYIASFSPSLLLDDDYWIEYDERPVENRCWVAFRIKHTGKISSLSSRFCITLEGESAPHEQYSIKGSGTDPNATPWEVDEYGYPMYGKLSSSFMRRALGAEVLWISNSYSQAECYPPSPGGRDFGQLKLTFGGSNSLEVCFNAPCAGTFRISGDFPYDYSYRSSSLSHYWTTETEGVTVTHLYSALPAYSSGFTHLLSVFLEVDRPGPCVLKSPVANDMVYPAVPRTPGRASPQYPGMASVDADGNKHCSTTVTIQFAPDGVRSVFIGTSYLQGGEAFGTVTPPQSWALGDKAVIEAAPYQGCAIDYWEWPEDIVKPIGLDLQKPKLEFVVTEDMCEKGQFAVKAHWKAGEAIVPNGFLKALLAGGRFGDDLETIRGATAMNGCMTVSDCYVAGVDPEDTESVFRANIRIENGQPVVTCEPRLSNAERALRKYTILGCKELGDEWSDCELSAEIEKQDFRYFKVAVRLR